MEQARTRSKARWRGKRPAPLDHNSVKWTITPLTAHGEDFETQNWSMGMLVLSPKASDS